MDSQPNMVLQNSTNIYGDGSVVYAFFQCHKHSLDDGTPEPLNKKLRIKVTTESQEAEPQSSVEDVVEDVHVPRTNTFRMLWGMYQVRNMVAQLSSTYPRSGVIVAEVDDCYY